MTYQEILLRDGARVVITGDSLSYNRYSYDDTPRENAFNCGVGLPSWPFALRDWMYTHDPQFLYGEELSFSCRCVPGLDNVSDVPYTAMFGGRIQTVYPAGDVTFTVPVCGEHLVLYFQQRSDAPCTLDILVDGQLVGAGINTTGSPDVFAGYGLLPVVLPCDPSRKEHVITFTNIVGEKITVAGVGARYTDVHLTGKGNQCVSFFVDHFEERIGRYAPDLLIIILTANDRGRVSVKSMQEDLEALLTLWTSRFPVSKLLFILPPSSHDPENPDSCVSPYTSLEVARTFDKTARRVLSRFQEDGFDVDVFELIPLFEGEPVSAWRHDNVHLNQEGNGRVLAALMEHMHV